MAAIVGGRYDTPMVVLVGSLAWLALAAVAWTLWGRVRAVERTVGELRLLRRELEAAARDAQRALGVTRQHLVEVAAGSPPPPEVVLAGRAWRPIEAAPALVLWERQPELFVLDVRTRAEFEAGHIPRAHLIPLDELEDRLHELPGRDEQILVTCAAGGRSAQACQILAEHGFTRLLNLAGGMHAWPGPRERSTAAPASAPVARAPEGTTIAYRGGAVTGEQVVNAIRQCFDPEIPLNVYDLGLIYGIDIDETAIGIRMTLTSEGCPSARQIPEEVKRRVAALGQPNVNVEVVFDPPWHPTRISAEGKAKLGIG